jgi:periplasmic divalent cation tolerance protein
MSNAAMSTPDDFRVVLVTAPDRDSARRLAFEALQARLVACANLIPGVESHFWWQGKIDTSEEVIIVFKTTVGCLEALEKTILAHHPYDVPEFIVLRILRGNKKYLKWIDESASGASVTA